MSSYVPGREGRKRMSTTREAPGASVNGSGVSTGNSAVRPVMPVIVTGDVPGLRTVNARVSLAPIASVPKFRESGVTANRVVRHGKRNAR